MTTTNRKEGASEDLLRYAPRWARHSPPVAPVLDALGEPSAPVAAPAPAAAPEPSAGPGTGSPDPDPTPPLQPFEGDVAIQDLRRRLSIDPDLVPQPPIRGECVPSVPWIGKFTLMLILAAMVGFGTAFLTVSHWQQGAAGAAAPAREGAATAPAASARLRVESQRASANEPLALGISLGDATGGESVRLTGLAAGTRLTAGRPLGPSGWQIAAHDLDKIAAHAPKDFVGAMELTIELRSARDRLLDSRAVRLEWVPRQEARPALEPGEVAALMKRAEDFLKTGDIASARLVLARAAGAGDAQAALTLGGTFDPGFLAEKGVLGLAPDLDQARNWYKQAADLGSVEASQRLSRLTR